MPKSARIKKFIKDFGIDPDRLNKLVEMSFGNDTWVGTREVKEFDLLRTVRRGMRGLRIFKKGYKPTANLTQLIGRGAQRAITLNQTQAEKFIRGLDLEIDCDLEPGFVIISFQGFPLGIGKYRDGHIKNQVPGAKRVRKGLTD